MDYKLIDYIKRTAVCSGTCRWRPNGLYWHYKDKILYIVGIEGDLGQGIIPHPYEWKGFWASICDEVETNVVIGECRGIQFEALQIFPKLKQIDLPEGTFGFYEYDDEDGVWIRCRDDIFFELGNIQKRTVNI